jgi:hypothetical protein
MVEHCRDRRALRSLAHPERPESSTSSRPLFATVRRALVIVLEILLDRPNWSDIKFVEIETGSQFGELN